MAMTTVGGTQVITKTANNMDTECSFVQINIDMRDTGRMVANTVKAQSTTYITERSTKENGRKIKDTERVCTPTRTGQLKTKSGTTTN